MIIISALFFVFSLWVASTCVKWSAIWWLNMFAAFLNFAMVVRYFAIG